MNINHGHENEAEGDENDWYVHMRLAMGRSVYMLQNTEIIYTSLFIIVAVVLGKVKWDQKNCMGIWQIPISV